MYDYSKYDDLKIEIKDEVATLAFDRPEYANAFSDNIINGYISALEKFSIDPNVRAVVITGSGKNFCAGGDIKSFKEMINNKTYINRELMYTVGIMGQAARKCLKPVIAMINGAAAGAGCSIAASCDFRFMTPKSRMIMSFSNLGLFGDTNGFYNLEKIVGLGKATHMAMTGEPLTAEEAERVMAATVVSEEELEEKTMEFAQKLAQRSTFILGKQKEAIWDTYFDKVGYWTGKEADGMYLGSRTEDFEEAVNAFIEKRPAKFTGK